MRLRTWSGSYVRGRLWPRVLLGWLRSLLALGCLLGCNPFQGTQGMNVSAAEFTNGTPRHPAPWDSALAELERCAQRYVDSLPAPADSLGGSPFMAERIDAPLDSLLEGGIWVLGNLATDTASHVSMANDRADAVYQRGARRLFITTHAYRLRDELEHELGHALSDYYPALRNPPGAANTNLGAMGAADHVGPFFRACVAYNPGV